MQQNRFRSITQIEDSHLFIAIELLQGFMFALFIGGNCSFVYQILLLLKVEFTCVMNLCFLVPVPVSHFWYEKDTAI